MTEIRKARTASQSYGRGSDQAHSTARYEIVVDGVVVGSIYGSDTSYGQRADWNVDRLAANGQWRPSKTFWASAPSTVRAGGAFKAAKAYAMKVAAEFAAAQN